MLGEVEEESLRNCLQRTIKYMGIMGESRNRAYPRNLEEELESLEIMLVVPMELRIKYSKGTPKGDLTCNHMMDGLQGYTIEADLAEIRTKPESNWPHEVKWNGCEEGGYFLTDRQLANILSLWHELREVYDKIGGPKVLYPILDRPELEGPNGFIASLIKQMNVLISDWNEFSLARHGRDDQPPARNNIEL